MSDLENRCESILNDAAIAEEDRIDAVEKLVRKEKEGLLLDHEIERLVLDILWAHCKGDKKRLGKPRIVGVRKSNQINFPQPYNSRCKSKDLTQWVPLEESLGQEDAKESPNDNPYDLLRGIVGNEWTDQDIERVLAQNEFDVGRTISTWLGLPSDESAQNNDQASQPTCEPFSKAQTASRIICKYYLQSGSCLRGSACLYKHDVSQRICRFWLQGRCLAGDKCLFLHSVPQEVLDQSKNALQNAPPKNFTSWDRHALPKLGEKATNKRTTTNVSSQQSWASVSELKNPGVAMSNTSSLKNVAIRVNKGLVPVTVPKHTPWKDKEFLQNEKYIELRDSARKSAELRNKYLQLATNRWSQNDPLTAKIFSKKGQGFHQRMVDLYAEGRELLIEQRHKIGSEIFVDLHGFELGEAIEYLKTILEEIETSEKHKPRPVYIITGHGHFKVKRHADQLTQNLKLFIDRLHYISKDFGEDPVYGRITGLDPWSAIK